MMRLNNSLANNLANITPAGNTAIQTQAKSVCATTALGNITSAGKKVVASLATPSTSYVTVSVPATQGTFTTTVDGYVVFSVDVHSGGWEPTPGGFENQGLAALINTTKGTRAQCTPELNFSGTSSASLYAADHKVPAYVTIPCSKGDTIGVYYRSVYPNGDKWIHVVSLKGA